MRGFMTGLVALSLTAVGCGGADAPAATYKGTWVIQAGTNGGTVIVRDHATTDSQPQVDGSWDFGAFGSGDMVGNVLRDGARLDLFFSTPDHSIVMDATVNISDDAMTGVARSPSGNVSLTGYRL